MPTIDFTSLVLGYICGIGIYHMIVSTVFSKEDSLY